MAFPIPTHLPRKQDVSSKILNRIDSATYRILNSTLTKSWLDELDETIQMTKTRLHERIQSDLPLFQHQLETAQSIHTRLHTLTNNVDGLTAAVSHPRSGLVPVLIQKLSEHSTLVQEATDIHVQHEALSHIFRCKTEFSNLLLLVKDGKLPEAVPASDAIDSLLVSASEPLSRSNIFLDFKRKFQSTKALIQEQLSDAYTRSVVISASHLIIRSSVQVRGSDNTISLTSVLSSFTPSSLGQHLTTLRRDLVAHFIEYALKQPSSVSISTTADAEHSLSLIPAPPNYENKGNRIDNLAQVFDFFSTYLFPAFPPSAFSSFPQSLLKPTTMSVLNTLLIPSLPPSFGLLPPFLDLAQRAVAFETKTVTQLGGTFPKEMPIKTWVDSLASHYEKQRRLELLGNCRNLILSPEGSKEWFQFEIEVPSESAQPTVVPVQMDEGGDMEINDLKDDAWGFGDDEERAPNDSVPTELEESDFRDDAWGLDDEEHINDEEKNAVVPVEATSSEDFPSEDVDSGWGFDDETAFDQPQPEVEGKPAPLADPKPAEVNNDSKPDSGDAWGWNNGEDAAEGTEDHSWDDDPWADPPDPDESAIDPASQVVVPPVITSPKAATRLEKIANKGKKRLNGHSAPVTSASIPLLRSPPPPVQPTSLHPPQASSIRPPNGSTGPDQSSTSSSKRPTQLKTNIVAKESFSVPDKAKRIIKAIENMIDECKQFQASSLFPPSSTTQPGHILAQTPASLIDLYIALYPVQFEHGLSRSAQKGMLFSNSCFYLGSEVEKIEKSLVASVGVGSGTRSGFEGLKERLEECARHLRVLGESWYEQVIQNQCERVDDILVDGGKGFRFTGDQDRYDECEMATSKVVREIKRLAQELKGVLTKGKYYTAIGLVTEAALSRILQDILALSDIPEVDSHRLSELCRILNSLEGLFSEDPTQPSFVVVYVPSWLKFNYLSELLEASMVDISYLFEEGALVDFEIDELVRLVKALFADTTLRTNTISKLMNGHPVPSS